MVDVAEKDTPSKNTRNILQKRKEKLKKIDYNLIVIRVQVDFPDTCRLRENKTEGNQIYLYINKNNIESLEYDETALEFLKKLLVLKHQRRDQRIKWILKMIQLEKRCKKLWMK